MGDVVLWPKHIRQVCHHEAWDDVNPDYRCGYCMGGLFTCSTCGASEGELATNCPGYRLHEDERAATMNGHIDFRSGQWIAVAVSQK